MDLEELAESYLGTESDVFLPDRGRVSQELLSTLGHEYHTGPVIASVFWASLVYSPLFGRAVAEYGVDPAAQGSKAIVVQHGGGWGRFDLVVLHPEWEGEPKRLRFDADPGALRQGWREVLRFSERDPSDRFGSLPLETLEEVPGEVGGNPDFGALIVPLPSLRHTAARPTSSLKAEVGGQVSTIGLLAHDREGRPGVTTAAHAVPANETQVYVAGVRGEVLSRDAITDSCFVGLDVDPRSHRAVDGPLVDLSPRIGEDVDFEGVASGRVATKVHGFDAGIPWIKSPWVQLSVHTKPVTIQGDSGAALVNADEQVLGFASYATGFGEEVEFSGWIWAESVFRAHGLT